MKKRLLSLFMALACLVSMFPMNIVAAESVDPNKCDHDYTAVVTEPTCTQKGYTTYTCSICKNTYKDNETATVPHTESVVEAVAPTCTETGLTEGKCCSVCGMTLISQETVEATGHTEKVVKEAVAPTCTETGLTAGTVCADCGVTMAEQETVEATGHTVKNIKEVPATCTETGTTAGTICSVCNQDLSGFETIPMVDHTEVTVDAVAPTCTEPGKTAGTGCSVCGAVLSGQETVEATGHSYETTVTEPTCTEEGYTTYTCTVCGIARIDEDTVPANGHSFDQGVCTVCGAETTYLEAPVVTASNVASSGKIKLTWDAVEGAVEYQVYRAASEGGEYKLMLTATNPQYTNTSAKAGKTYSYYVVAVAEDGTVSEHSNIVTQICMLARPEVTASNVTSSGKVKLTWEAIDGAVEYQVYRSTAKDGEYKLTYTATSTSYTNTKAKAGQKYYYYVIAIAENEEANSVSSAIKSRTCDLARPEVTASNVASSGKVKLTWDAVEGAVKYQIYRSTAKDGKYTLTYTATSTSYVNSKAKAGTTYYYKVRAISENTDAHSVYSAVKSRTCDFAYPTVKVTGASSTSIRLSWNEVEGAIGYVVYRSTSKDGDYTKLKSVTSLSYNDKTVEAGDTYYYRVVTRAENSSAHSAKSPAVSATAALSAPTLNSTANSNASAIKISWNKNTAASGYYVYRRSASGNDWKRISTITDNSTTSYKDSNASGRYFYCVAAYETINGTTTVSAKSDAIRARTLGKPTVSVEGSEDTCQNVISWSAVNGATGYQIYYQTGDNMTGETGSWKRAATVEDVTSYTHETEHGVHYRYKVRAIYTYKGTTTLGAYSTFTDWHLHHVSPKFTVSMYTDSYDAVQGTTIEITNNGVGPMRFYTDGLWLDAEDSDYDRSVKLYDYAAYVESETYVEIDYVDVAAGATETLLVIADSETRYNSGTQIALNMYYDGVYYVSVCHCKDPYYYIAE